MSVKKMIQLYVNYGLNTSTWDMLYQMVLHGLISTDNWNKFYDVCRGLEFDDAFHIIDSYRDCAVVYIKDCYGFWVEA